MTGARIIFVAAMLAALATPETGRGAESAYTKVDLEKGCRWEDSDGNGIAPDEIVDGACSTCPGHGGNVVRICEGDLRQSAGYGPDGVLEMGWASFAQFNSIAPTVEWRLEGGRAVAAIHRQFVDNAGDDGAPDERRRGQVLVISTVARPGQSMSCPVGYVDARANANANELARQVADSLAAGFRCGIDRPQFHGRRGGTSGDPIGIGD